MVKLGLLIAAGGGLAAGLAMLPATAAAQNSSLGEIIVYGDDPCPRSTDDEVVVCVRRPETERYRIPETLRVTGSRQEREAWINQARPIMNAGNTGINSCSAVGPAGHTGCLLQEINEARDAREQTQEDDTPPED